jgi:hypothetical protein
MKTFLLAIALILTAASLSSSGSWGPWQRRLADGAAHLIATWCRITKGLPRDLKTKKNVKWMAELGSQSYGNPVVAGGMVFVGTNNEGLRDPKQPEIAAC